MRFYCNPVPVLTVTSIALDSTGNTATLTTSNPLPKSGCFNLRIAGGPRCVNINPCATEQVIVTDGTTTYSNVYGRCGNYLQLGQIAWNIRRWNCLHFVVTTAPAGNLMSLDKLCPPRVGPDIVTGVSETTTPAPASEGVKL